jgi:hypothetical protein
MSAAPPHRCLSPWKGAVAGGLIVLAVRAAFRGGAGPLDALALGTAAFFWTWILGKIPGLTLRSAALYGLFFGICAAALETPRTWAYAVESVAGWSAASAALSRCYAPSCELPVSRRG